MALSIDRAIGFAGLVSSLPGLIEVCIHLGDFVVNRLGAYQKWDVSVADYTLKVSVHWDIQKHGLLKLQRLGDDVETDVRARLAQVLLRLKKLLEEAGTVLSRHVPAHAVKKSALGSSLERLKFSLFEDKTLTDLDKRIGEWETLFVKQLVLVAESTPDSSPTTKNEQLGYRIRPELMADNKLRQGCEDALPPGSEKKLRIPQNHAPNTLNWQTHRRVQGAEGHQHVIYLILDMAPEIHYHYAPTGDCPRCLSHDGTDPLKHHTASVEGGDGEGPNFRTGHTNCRQPSDFVTRALRYSTFDYYLERLGRVTGFEDKLAGYYVRRCTSNAVDGQQAPLYPMLPVNTIFPSMNTDEAV